MDQTKLDHERLRRELWIKVYLECAKNGAPEFKANQAVEYFDRFFEDENSDHE
jgi:hypothetical protein